MQVQVPGASTIAWCKYIPEADQSKHNLVVKMLQCCGVVARELGARWWWRSWDDPSTPLPDFFQRVFLAPTDVQESLSGVDADPIGAKSI